MTGHCHCGTVTVHIAGKPDYLYDCNCSLCRKSGALWGYLPADAVGITGAPTAYRRNDRHPSRGALYFCGVCGCTVHWLATDCDRDGTVVVNMRLFDQSELGGVPIHFPNGADWSGDGAFDFRAPPTVHKGTVN